MKNGCVTGIGAIGPIHASALSSIGSLYSVCDINLSRLKTFCPNNDTIKRFSDYDTALNDKSIDVMHICTPHYLHKDMTVRAMEHGKSVVLEKPAAMNRHEFDELCRAAELMNGKICVMLQNRTNPGIAAMKEIIRNGSLGKLKNLTGILTWHRDADYYRHDAWRGKIETEGGGVLINQAIHIIDLLCFLGGKIKSVRGSISNKTIGDIIEVEDTADAIFKTELGLNICFYATNGCSYNRPIQIEAEFENGQLRYADSRLYKITDSACETIMSDIAETPGKPYWGGGHKKVITDFYNFLDTGNGKYITLNDAAPAMKALYAFYESAKQNREINIE